MDKLLWVSLGFTIGLSGALMPGPLLIYTLSRALKQGTKAGIIVTTGHFLIEVIVVLLILIGGGFILGFTSLRNYITWIGAIALIVMGILLFKRSFNIEFTQHEGKNLKYGVMGGAFFTAFNPGFPIWWASIGAPIILKIYLTGILGVILFMLGHWASDFGWYIFISYGVSKGKSYLSGKGYQIFSRVLSLLLVGFGIYFLII